MSLVDAFRGRNQPQLIPDSHLTALSPATYYLREWDEYLIEAPLADRVLFGSMEAECLTEGLFRYCFKNQLGLTTINAFTAGKPLGIPLHVEVISAKFPTLAEHIDFYRSLLNDLLRPHDLHFGYRIFDEIVAFLVAAESNKLYDDQDGAEAAFDAAVLMKVLPKFHGSRSRLEKPLCAVLAWCVNPGAPDAKTVEDALQEVGLDKSVRQAMTSSLFLYPKTAERVQRMLARLYTDGFAAFG